MRSLDYLTGRTPLPFSGEPERGELWATVKVVRFKKGAARDIVSGFCRELTSFARRSVYSLVKRRVLHPLPGYLF
jgi:hypothetical protein